MCFLSQSGVFSSGTRSDLTLDAYHDLAYLHVANGLRMQHKHTKQTQAAKLGDLKPGLPWFSSDALNLCSSLSLLNICRKDESPGRNRSVG